MKKNILKKLLLFLILSLLPCYFISVKETHATYNTTVQQSTNPYQYIIFNKVDQEQSASNYTWNPHNIKTITQESIEDFRSKMPESQESGVKVGLQLIVPYFNITHNESVALIKKITQLSQTNQVPILIRLDGFIDWDQRDDLWKWWDPNISPQEAERRKNNVEWIDWSSDSAIGISWRNWGWQVRIPPQPNLCSEDYKKAKENELSTLLPLIKNWYDSLPENQKYLFAGVVLDTEVSIGVNYYYYTDDAYSPKTDPKYAPVNGGVNNTNPTKFTITSKSLKYDDPTDWDPNFNLNSPIDKITKGPSYGRQQLGYAAISTCGIKNSGTITADDLDQVVKDHNTFLAKIGKRYFPPDKVFVHGMWNLSDNPATGFKSSGAVTNIVAPGLTIYGNQALRFPGIQDIQEALEANQKIKFWGAAEYSILPTTGKASGDTAAWFNSMSKILETAGSKLITIYSWRDVATYESRGQGIFAAVENLVNGDPTNQVENDDSLFALTDNKSSCQVTPEGKIAPAVNLSWGEYKGATDYKVYKIEIGAISQNLNPKLTKGELKFTDFDVTPGKLYFYQIEPVLSSLDKKTLKTDNISVGACMNTTNCKPYQIVITNQTGEQICIDRVCEDRTNDICTLDNKCMLTSGYWGTGCTIKVTDTSSFIATYGTELESTAASLCRKYLNNAGIYLDDHLSLCKQKASDKTTGCLNSVDVNDFTGCIQRVAQQTIDQLTPGIGQVVTTQTETGTSATQPEQQAQRVPTHVYLQIPDGEVELPLSGGNISLPIKANPTVVRVKILFDKPDQSGSNEVFRTFTVAQKTTQEVTGCNPQGDIVPPGHPDSWTFDRIDCTPNDPNNRGQKWVCGNTVKYAYGEDCPPTQGSYEDTIHSAELKSQCKLCKYSQYVNGEVKCFNGVPEDPNKEYGFNNNCIWVPECGTDPVLCP